MKRSKQNVSLEKKVHLQATLYPGYCISLHNTTLRLTEIKNSGFNKYFMSIYRSMMQFHKSPFDGTKNTDNGMQVAKQ